MQVTDLSNEQREELRQSCLCDIYDRWGISPSYGELADADELVTDALLYALYEGFSFTNDDFFCTAGEE